MELRTLGHKNLLPKVLCDPVDEAEYVHSALRAEKASNSQMRYYSLIRVFRSCVFCSLSPFISRQDKSQKEIGVAGRRRKGGREREIGFQPHRVLGIGRELRSLRQTKKITHKEGGHSLNY